MEYIIQKVLELVADMWYLGIFFMMTIESSFFPFPSEIAMVPAWALAAQEKMNFAVAFMAWTAWAMFWASINYLIGWKIGWPALKKIIEKYGKYVFLSVDHYNKTEYFFLDHGSVATFLGRLITGIRQIISIPAGVFKMNFFKFLFYTWVGAGLWNLILMVIGYLAVENQELIEKYSFWAFIASFIFVGISWYLYYQRRAYPNRRSFSYLLLFDKDTSKIMIHDVSNDPSTDASWCLFGWEHDYWEKPKQTVIRVIESILGLNTSSSVKYLWKTFAKNHAKKLIEKRHYFYDRIDVDISELDIQEGEKAALISIEDLEKLEKFNEHGKSLNKLIYMARRAQKNLIKNSSKLPDDTDEEEK